MSARLEAVNCRLCRGTESRRIWREFPYTALSCQVCGVIWVLAQDAPAASLYNEFYYRENYLAYEGLRTAYMAGLASRLSGFSPRGGVLCDVGCGPGYFLDAMRRKGWQVSGVEPSSFAREYAAKKWRAPIAESLDALSSSDFDLITLLDVLAHVQSPRELLELVARRLKPGGLLAIKTPLRSPLQFRLASFSPVALRGWFHIPAQIFHFSKRSLDHVAAGLGLTPVQARAIPELVLPVSWSRSKKIFFAHQVRAAVNRMGFGSSLLAVYRK